MILGRKKLFISHRGNINGRRPELENSPEYIGEALDEGYDVEIDAWFVDNKWYLGHDEPKYPIRNEDFFRNNSLWCHCKNKEAMVEFFQMGGVNYFWHQKDDYTLTSDGWIWAYPGEQVIDGCIAVLPELEKEKMADCLSKATGICSDYIERYKKQFKNE